MFLFSKSNSLLGIDIGTSYIKAVQLRKAADKPVLESYGVVNVIYPTESQIKFDAVKQTSEILSQLYLRSGFTTKKVVVSIPSNVAFVSILSLPPMPVKEMEKSVEYQAKKYIPLPISDVSLGWQVLEETNYTKPLQQKEVIPRVKVLLTAVPRNVINNYLRVVETAGFEVAALEIESLSLIRSLIDPTDREGSLIVDIGAKATILSYVYQGYLYATRHLTIGSDTITTSVANSMGISFERADQMKRTAFGPGTVSPATKIAKNIVELIKNEIQQFIRMTENQSRGLAKIILSGGGSKMPGLEDEFAGLAPKIDYGKPLNNISFDRKLESKLTLLSPQLAVAIGLALRRDV